MLEATEMRCTVVVLGTPGLVGNDMCVVSPARRAALVSLLAGRRQLCERRQRQQRFTY